MPLHSFSDTLSSYSHSCFAVALFAFVDVVVVVNLEVSIRPMSFCSTNLFCCLKALLRLLQCFTSPSHCQRAESEFYGGGYSGRNALQGCFQDAAACCSDTDPLRLRLNLQLQLVWVEEATDFAWRVSHSKSCYYQCECYSHCLSWYCWHYY